MLRLLGPRSVVLVAVACACGWLAASANAFVYWSSFAGSRGPGRPGRRRRQWRVHRCDAGRGRCRRLRTSSTGPTRAPTRLAAPTSTAPLPTRASSPARRSRAVSPSTRDTSTGPTRRTNSIGRANLDGTGRESELHHRRQRARGRSPSTPATSTGPTTQPARSAAPPWLHPAATSSVAASPELRHRPGRPQRRRARLHQRLLGRLWARVDRPRPIGGVTSDNDFIGGLNSPSAVAVDAGHVYWTSFPDNAIGRANLDGSAPTSNFIAGANEPQRDRRRRRRVPARHDADPLAGRAERLRRLVHDRRPRHRRRLGQRLPGGLAALRGRPAGPAGHVRRDRARPARWPGPESTSRPTASTRPTPPPRIRRATRAHR